MRIRSKTALDKILDVATDETDASTLREGGLLPTWGEGALCILAPGALPSDAFVVMNTLEHLTEEKGVVIVTSSSGAVHMGLLSPALIFSRETIGTIRDLLNMEKCTDSSSQFQCVCNIIPLSMQHHDYPSNLRQHDTFMSSISTSTPWKSLLGFTRESQTHFCSA